MTPPYASVPGTKPAGPNRTGGKLVLNRGMVGPTGVREVVTGNRQQTYYECSIFIL